jgi:uncharacterized protein YjbI with pentapeptide repeats
MRRASAKRAIWGTPGPRNPTKPPRADFSHAVLTGADLTEAKICGYFYGTKLDGVSLVRADLSHSTFLGPKFYEMTFAGANMNGANLSDCQISSASFFKADCTETDFSRTVVTDVRIMGCKFGGDRFRGAEIDKSMFTPDKPFCRRPT